MKDILAGQASIKKTRCFLREARLR